MSLIKVAVVTGSNKGIGFGTVRGLCKQFDGDVFLTSRNVERGLKAVEDLKKENLHPKFHQLDVTDKKSVETFRDFIKANYSGIDVLVNNAGILFKDSAPEPKSVQAEETLRVNYYALLSTCDILFPIMKKGGRVVNVSSSYCTLSNVPDAELRNKLKDPSLTVPELSQLVQKYIDDTKAGTRSKWGSSSYTISKIAVTALTMIQQRDVKDKGIIVNAVDPGYVNTDMSDHHGYLTIDQGAVSSLYAAQATESLTYRYIDDNKRIVKWN